ncbi:hypothetical protein RND71_038446 [Anisodus tanguticus]|uniref:Uncharacterized protein n=1 Tax=Anisodus tanguticus TaxID=243964 RepID=A0AAE1QZQ7_9SOLA|nr:hypothetical protein RND71_038446 [Anisodus tanguticus]
MIVKVIHSIPSVALLPMDQDMMPAYHAKGAASGYAKDVLALNRVLEMLKVEKKAIIKPFGTGDEELFKDLFNNHFAEGSLKAISYHMDLEVRSKTRKKDCEGLNGWLSRLGLDPA